MDNTIVPIVDGFYGGFPDHNLTPRHWFLTICLLPRKLQAKLNLPRSCDGSCDSTGVGAHGAIGRKHARLGKAQIGVIEEIEELRAKFDVLILANTGLLQH